MVKQDLGTELELNNQETRETCQLEHALQIQLSNWQKKKKALQTQVKCKRELVQFLNHRLSIYSQSNPLSLSAQDHDDLVRILGAQGTKVNYQNLDSNAKRQRHRSSEMRDTRFVQVHEISVYWTRSGSHANIAVEITILSVGSRRIKDFSIALVNASQTQQSLSWTVVHTKADDTNETFLLLFSPTVGFLSGTERVAMTASWMTIHDHVVWKGSQFLSWLSRPSDQAFTSWKPRMPPYTVQGYLPYLIQLLIPIQETDGSLIYTEKQTRSPETIILTNDIPSLLRMVSRCIPNDHQQDTASLLSQLILTPPLRARTVRRLYTYGHGALSPPERSLAPYVVAAERLFRFFDSLKDELNENGRQSSPSAPLLSLLVLLGHWLQFRKPSTENVS